MSHTPGPWAICQASRDAGRTVIDAHGRSITFTPVFHGSAAPDLSTAAANARLIAAAPDLLAALVAIRAALHQHTPDMPTAMLLDICPAIDAATAALAKVQA